MDESATFQRGLVGRHIHGSRFQIEHRGHAVSGAQAEEGIAVVVRVEVDEAGGATTS